MYSKLLKDKKISVTKQRLALLELLAKHKKPLTIEQIRKDISIDIDQATIYRSLSLLVKKGLIYQTDFRESVAYYELQLESDHHHHLVCLECKNKEGIDFCPDLPKEKILKNKGFSVQHHVFELFGLCKTCSKN